MDKKEKELILTTLKGIQEILELHQKVLETLYIQLLESKLEDLTK